MKLPQLLSPAGSLEKGLTAFHFGADAVYCGVDGYSLRAPSSSIEPGDLEKLVEEANRKAKKVYLATNIFPYDDDFVGVERTLSMGRDCGVHGIIVSDPGVATMALKKFPGIPVHLSTQANVINSRTAAFWLEQGISRIILARELSLRRVQEICRWNRAGEFEIFIHGAMCMAYSGRCFISKYLSGMDANRGLCTHGCRWNYYVQEEQRPQQQFSVEEDDNLTRIFFSRDLCTLPFLPQILDCGVGSLKIEGRMKSLYYVAVVTSVYRQALDCIAADEAGFMRRISGWRAELLQAPNRGFTSGFYLGRDDDPADLWTDYDAGQPEQPVFLGVFGNRDEQWIDLEVKNTFQREEKLEIFRPEGTLPIFIDEIRDHRDDSADTAHSGQRVRVRESFLAVKGDLLRRRKDREQADILK